MSSDSAAASSSPLRAQEWPLGVRIALVGLAYFALARLGLAFATITANVSPIWPPAGLAFGTLIIGGLRLWPGVACGAFAAALSAGAEPWAALLMAAGNTLEPVVTVALLRKLFEFRDDFERPRHVVGFILLHGAVGTPLSALLGTGALWLDGKVGGEHWLAAALTWWGGNFAGGLVLGPLLIAAQHVVMRARPAALLRELVGLTALLVIVGGTVFVWGPPWGLSHPTLIVLPFPLLIWIAWRFAIGGAALSLLLLSILAVWGTALGGGPFGALSPRAAYGFLLVYLAVVALTSLVLAAFNVQREQVLSRLRQREWQLSEAQRIGNLGVWVWDLRTDSFQLSEGGLRILGGERAEFAPKIGTFLERVHPEDRRQLEELILRVRRSDRRESCEVRIPREDGPPRYITVACSALRSSRGQATTLLGTLFDVTERKRYEDEQASMQRKLLETQKLESLGLLAGGIAHDFNNLLTGILGNSSLLRLQLPEGSPQHEGLRRIETSAERAADLCRQMLAYSGKGRFVIRTVELNELVRSTLALAQSTLPKRADLTFTPAAALPGIRADLLQLRQVLLNLAINAAEALPETGGRVAVRTGTVPVDRTWFAGAYLAPDLPEGEYVFLEVEDTGAGIPPELLPKIFDPFFSTKFTGRGLGLAAVAGIVRAHHGAIRVSSQPGRGTTFRIVFPPAPPEPRPAAAGAPTGTARAIAPTSATTAPVHVLIVDDEDTIREIAAEVLVKNGHSTTVAEDGRRALELFARDDRRFHVVLLDYAMPHLDGLETFRQLRQRRTDLPVILMSGFEREEALDRFVNLGLAGFLQKPFTPTELLAAIAHATARTPTPVR